MKKKHKDFFIYVSAFIIGVIIINITALNNYRLCGLIGILLFVIHRIRLIYKETPEDPKE